MNNPQQSFFEAETPYNGDGGEIPQINDPQNLEIDDMADNLAEEKNTKKGFFGTIIGSISKGAKYTGKGVKSVGGKIVQGTKKAGEAVVDGTRKVGGVVVDGTLGAGKHLVKGTGHVAEFTLFNTLGEERSKDLHQKIKGLRVRLHLITGRN